jgi:hypothetical protein
LHPRGEKKFTLQESKEKNCKEKNKTRPHYMGISTYLPYILITTMLVVVILHIVVK